MLHNISRWLCIAALGVVLTGCSGNTEDSGVSDPQSPILSADKNQITADGDDAVRFQVKVGDADVTASAVIRCVSHSEIAVADASFRTSVPGEYRFEAEYQGKISRAYSVFATEFETPSEPSRFIRQICIMEFTGQWCGNCPTGYNYLYRIISRYYSETAHILALHDDSGGKDEMALPIQKDIFAAFKLSAYPAALTDMRDVILLNNDTNGLLKKSLEASLNDYPAHCGIAVKSECEAGSTEAVVTVRLTSERTEEYRIALWVVEDGIVASQNIGSGYSDEYTHNHVARQLVSTTWQGDRLGNVAAGEEFNKTYQVTIDKAWNLENTKLFALAIGADGTVNNMAVCNILNGNTDYAYIEKN